MENYIDDSLGKGASDNDNNDGTSDDYEKDGTSDNNGAPINDIMESLD